MIQQEQRINGYTQEQIKKLNGLSKTSSELQHKLLLVSTFLPDARSSSEYCNSVSQDATNYATQARVLAHDLEQEGREGPAHKSLIRAFDVLNRAKDLLTPERFPELAYHYECNKSMDDRMQSYRMGRADYYLKLRARRTYQ